ncbi:acyl-ACP thioesterase domain-containing protein [Lactobacillus sp. LL6]|uniref:acyl-[acyl-carrier-protein] thioesterase n=1 Tax=Lactobacillus sp. LL6 TaxID=2596827 RepID=UPI001184EBF1|nr:acyl-ACP thioesterase domain-containing protein [Lactobacillus sp. LL6]TSO25902.1 acyl-[acyl-carrier-protein] thioesterase [Lactobacillus sp. LL6]
MRYSEKHTVEFGECDENRHLKIPTMIDLLMMVSEHQLDAGDAGTDDLVKRGLGWVVTQYHFDIVRLPSPGEKIVLTTEASGYNRFFEYRDFSITDYKGQEIVTVKSQWVLFDLKQRKLTPTDSELMESFDVPLLKKMPRFPRLRLRNEYDIKRKYRVRYDDLDTNHHLTNSHYFNWFVDMMSRDFLRDYVIESIDIKFDKEVQYGEEPVSVMKLEKNGSAIYSHHAILNENGKEQALCELKWRKI